MKRTKSFALIASILLCLAAFASSSFAANPLVNPRGLAVDAKDNLWSTRIVLLNPSTESLIDQPSNVLNDLVSPVCAGGFRSQSVRAHRECLICVQTYAASERPSNASI